MLKRYSLLAFFALALPVAVLADQETGTYQYAMESADKKYIFVMLRGCSSDGSVDLYDSEKYPESGLYLNDGSAAPLWTVDWCGYVLLPSDGIHIVRKGPWARTREGYSVEAITFFADGKLLKSYRVCDLVTIPWLLQHSSSHYEWQRLIPAEEGAQSFSIQFLNGGSYSAGSGVVFDESAHTMRIATLQGDTYLFDVNTGEILSSARPVRTITISLSAFLVLLYAWYLMRATARPRLPLWKLYQRLAFNALVMAWLSALLGFGLLAAVRHMPGEDRSLVLVAGLRVFVSAPIEIARRNEWLWARPFGNAPHPFYLAQNVLYLLGFWLFIFGVVLMTNSTLVRCVRSVRQRWGSGATETLPQESGAQLSIQKERLVSHQNIRRPGFREVQHFSRFWLGLGASFLSLFFADGLLSALLGGEAHEDPLFIPIYAFMGVLLPILLLNIKMVTKVSAGQVVVGLRLLWHQKGRIALDDIRQCSIQPRHSHEQNELMVRKYAVWAPLGVLIELTEGDWILIGSQRPHELLEAIQSGQRTSPTD